MPSQWDHKADKHLLLAIIDEGSLKSILWPKIAEKMSAKGYSFTHEACRQHFQKIRKDSKNPSTNSSSGPSASTPPRGPRNKSATTTPRKTSKLGKGAAGTTNSSDDDEELPPSSKRKRVVKKEEPSEDFEQENGTRATPAYQFKVEQMGEGGLVDLENSDMYDAY